MATAPHGSQAFGDYKKEQAFTYTSTAAHIGFGPRSNPNMHMPTWTPAPGEYPVAKDADKNDAPHFK